MVFKSLKVISDGLWTVLGLSQSQRVLTALGTNIRGFSHFTQMHQTGNKVDFVTKFIHDYQNNTIHFGQLVKQIILIYKECRLDTSKIIDASKNLFLSSDNTLYKYLSLAEFLLEIGELQVALENAKKFSAIVKKTDNFQALISSHFVIMKILIGLEKYEMALTYGNELLKHIDQISSNHNRYMIYFHMESIYLGLKKYDKALIYADKFFTFKEKKEFSFGDYVRLMVIYSHLGEYENVFKSFQTALDTTSPTSQDLFKAYYILGEIHYQNKEFGQSLKYLLNILKLEDYLNLVLPKDLITIYTYIGDIYYKKADLHQSLHYFLKILKLEDRIEIPFGSEKQIIYLYLELQQFNKCICFLQERIDKNGKNRQEVALYHINTYMKLIVLFDFDQCDQKNFDDYKQLVESYIFEEEINVLFKYTTLALLAYATQDIQTVHKWLQEVVKHHHYLLDENYELLIQAYMLDVLSHQQANEIEAAKKSYSTACEIAVSNQNQMLLKSIQRKFGHTYENNRI